MRTVVVLVVAWALMGSIALTFDAGTTSATGEYVEVRMGALASGSTVTSDYAEGTATAIGVLSSTRTDLLYLNNTNATGVWHVKLAQVSATGVSNIVTLTIGVDNGTSTSPQIVGSLGSITQTEGSYVRLEPASANRIYVTRSVSLLGPDIAIVLNVYAADTSAANAYVITNANVTIT